MTIDNRTGQRATQRTSNRVSILAVDIFIFKLILGIHIVRKLATIVLLLLQSVRIELISFIVERPRFLRIASAAAARVGRLLVVEFRRLSSLLLLKLFLFALQFHLIGLSSDGCGYVHFLHCLEWPFRRYVVLFGSVGLTTFRYAQPNSE